MQPALNEASAQMRAAEAVLHLLDLRLEAIRFDPAVPSAGPILLFQDYCRMRLTGFGARFSSFEAGNFCFLLRKLSLQESN